MMKACSRIDLKAPRSPRPREALWSAAALRRFRKGAPKQAGFRDKGGTKKRVILSAVFEAKDLTGQDKSAQRRGVSGECQRAGPQLRDKLFTFELFGVYWEVLRFEDYAQDDSKYGPLNVCAPGFAKMWVMLRDGRRTPKRWCAEVSRSLRASARPLTLNFQPSNLNPS